MGGVSVTVILLLLGGSIGTAVGGVVGWVARGVAVRMHRGNR